MRNLFVFVSLFLFVGCSVEIPRISLSHARPLKIQSVKGSVQRISVMMDECRIEELRELLPDNISYCWDDSLNDKTISLDVENVTLDEFLVAVSKSAKVPISKIGDIWFFGGQTADQDKRGVAYNQGGYNFVFDLSGFSVDEVKEMFNGTGGTMRNVKSSIYVFSGTVEQIVTAKKLYDDVRSLKPSEYQFDLYMVSSELLHKYGVSGQIDQNLDIGLNLGRGLSDWQWNLVLSAVEQCSLTRNTSNTYRYVSGVFREGKEFKYTLGDRIPVVKKTVSDTGSVTNSGVDYIQVGLNVQISCIGSALGLFDLSLQMNETSSYIENYPVQHGSSFDTTLYIRDDRYRFVGHVEYGNESKSLLGMTNNVTTWYLFLRVRRMGEGEFFYVNEEEIKGKVKTIKESNTD